MPRLLDVIEDVIMLERGRLRKDCLVSLCAAEPAFRSMLNQCSGLHGLAVHHPHRFEYKPNPGSSLVLSAKRQRELFGVQAHRLQAQVLQEGAVSVLVGLIAELLEHLGGAMLVEDTPKHLKHRMAHALPLYYEVLTHPSAYHDFVAEFSQRFEWSPGAEPGQHVIALPWGQRVSTVLSSCRELLLCSGGYVPEHEVVGKFRLRHCRLLQAQLNEAGGLKRFASLHPQWLCWRESSDWQEAGLTLPPYGPNAYSEVASEAANEVMLVQALVDVLEANGGWLRAVAVGRLLRDEGTWRAARLLEAIASEGGLKLFITSRPEHFEWLSAADALHNFVCSARPMPPVPSCLTV